MTSQYYQGQQCLHFYYHLWADNIKLNILSISKSDSSINGPYWTRSNNYGDEWNLGEITVIGSNLEDEFKVVFEGMVMDSWYGNIAIDDVTLESRPCRAPGYCDFDSLPRFCTWSNVQSKIRSFLFLGTRQ
jgi:hypothetical protein